MIDIKYDFSNIFGQARDQGRRGTCLLFALSDLNKHEHQHATHLSVDYLAHHVCAKGYPWRDGVALTNAGVVLDQCGQPDESTYPYDGTDQDRPTRIPVNVKPPFLASAVTPLSPSNGFSQLYYEIESGKPIGIILWVKNCLFSPNRGIVSDVIEINRGLHAVIGVGVGQHQTTSEPHIMIRNSWGTSWGINGHAWIPKSYFDSSLNSTFEVANGHSL